MQEVAEEEQSPMQEVAEEEEQPPMDEVAKESQPVSPKEIYNEEGLLSRRNALEQEDNAEWDNLKDNKRILLIFEISDILNSTDDNDTIENILKGVETKLNNSTESQPMEEETETEEKIESQPQPKQIEPQPQPKQIYTTEGKPINNENEIPPADQVKNNLFDELMEVGGKLKQKRTSLKKKKPSKKQSKSKKTKRIQIKKRKQTKKVKNKKIRSKKQGGAKIPYVGPYYKNPSAKLWDGVYENNYKMVEEAFKEGADVNMKNDDGAWFLIVAAEGGNERMVNLFLEKGIDVNITDHYNNTALSTAVRNSRYDVVKLLLKKGADINKENNDGDTPLMHAINSRDIDMVQLLLKHPDIKNEIASNSGGKCGKRKTKKKKPRKKQNVFK